MKKPLSKRTKKRLSFLITMVLIITALLFSLRRLDNVLIPVAFDIAQRAIVSDIAKIIDNAYSTVIEEKRVESTDLFNVYFDNNSGKVSSIFVNTVLVNYISNYMAVRVSSDLNMLTSNLVSVPVGSLSGFQMFSNMGPTYKIRIRPVGEATVNLRTEREAIGINQVHFLVWMDVKCEVQIIAPLQEGRIVSVTRSLPLINTYFSQEVPNVYWNS